MSDITVLFFQNMGHGYAGNINFLSLLLYCGTIADLSRNFTRDFLKAETQSTSVDPRALRQTLSSVVQGISAGGLPRSHKGAAGSCWLSCCEPQRVSSHWIPKKGLIPD